MTKNNHSVSEEPKEGTAMQTIDLEFLSLSSYTRLCTMISICLGFATGVIFFIADLVGVNTSVQLGIVHVGKLEAGILVLFTGPFIFAVVGFVGSLLSYRFFLWALRRFWGLALTGKWKDVSASSFRGTVVNHLHPS
jgi:hypothetical protein